MRSLKGEKTVQPIPTAGPTTGIRRSRWARFALVATSAATYWALRWHQGFVEESPIDQPVYAVCSHGSDGLYTVDASDSVTQCMVVKDGFIADTGSIEDMKKRWPNVKPIVTPHGSMILPGMTESHMHSFLHANYRMLELETAKTIPDAVALVRELILSDPDILHNTSKVVEGFGWDATIWPEKRLPTAADLDADDVVRGRQVMLRSKDAHSYWVSGKTLELNAPYPDKVEGGRIERDANGHETGVFIDSAQDLIAYPQYTDSDLLKKITYTMNDALSWGITSIHDAKLDQDELDFFHRQALAGNLKVRFHGWKFFEGDLAGYWGNTTKRVYGAGNGRWTQRSVKIVADGSLRSRSSYLYDDYADEPGNKGFMRVSAEVLEKVIPMFLADGWQVNVHGIGDRANGHVVTALEKSLAGVNVTAARPRIEHAQIMTDKDIVRLGKLGVIASIQPTHAIDDMWYAEERLGPERIKGLYAFRKLIDAGSRITLGSDSPVETMNPVAGMFAALTRTSFDGTSPHGPRGWFPDQKLARLEVLRGYTIDPAYASFTENELGSLEVGKRADFVVLSQDVMKVSMNNMMATKVLATAIDGEVVYGNL